MADRVFHRVANWEDLLKMSDPLAIKSSNVTAESPIHIYLNRRELIATIQNSVKCIEANAPTLDTTPAAVADTVHLLTQRKQFLTWLRAQNGDNLYVALYPHSEFELVPEEEEEEEGE
jgi:hypothetical protein